MRILICSPTIPVPETSGLKIRVFNLARQLARQHDVHLFCLSEEPLQASQEDRVKSSGLELTVVSKPENPLTEKLSAYGRRIAAGVPPEFILSWESAIGEALEALDRDGGFDIAVAEHLFMARHVRSLACPRVLVLHNIESDLAAALAATYPQPARSYKRLAARWASAYEKRMLASMQGAVTVTREDMGRLQQLAPGLPAAVVENGVDCSAFRELAAAPRPGKQRLLYVGLMSYESNVDAVRWFSEEVLPLVRGDFPETVFTIAGGDPAPEVQRLVAIEGVAVSGFVPDVKPLYRDNDLLVVPLRHGGGSRLKILEAFASGTPVVSTTKGAEGLDVEDGIHLQLADSPAAMAAAIGRVFAGDDGVLAASASALALVEERYDWPILAGKLSRFLTDIAGRKR